MGRRQGGRGGVVVGATGASPPLLLGALVPALPRLHAEISGVLLQAREQYPDASIAFVSSDKDSKAWASYFQSMGEHWLALPYDARDQKEKLSKAFGVNGIPSLVLLDSEA